MHEANRLLLVDYENVHKVDLSVLDETFRAIIYVGAKQNPPKAARNPATAHRFRRVDFQKIEGSGKNALDFHIAFQLGRTFEKSPGTECFVLSKDKGFEPLLAHLNKSGMKCLRVDSLDALASSQKSAVPTPAAVVCRRCSKASTIEHHGGLWCTNCGSFASPPDPNRLPSNQPAFRNNHRRKGLSELVDQDQGIMATCGHCGQYGDMTGGIYDDGEWMCGLCIARYVD